jgi:hypothetical protein
MHWVISRGISAVKSETPHSVASTKVVYESGRELRSGVS